VRDSNRKSSLPAELPRHLVATHNSADRLAYRPSEVGERVGCADECCGRHRRSLGLACSGGDPIRKAALPPGRRAGGARRRTCRTRVSTADSERGERQLKVPFFPRQAVAWNRVTVTNSAKKWVFVAAPTRAERWTNTSAASARRARYRPPSIAGNDGSFALTLSSPDAGLLQLPGGRTVPIIPMPE
jgi:hypothetical protein